MTQSFLVSLVIRKILFDDILSRRRQPAPFRFYSFFAFAYFSSFLWQQEYKLYQETERKKKQKLHNFTQKMDITRLELENQ